MLCDKPVVQEAFLFTLNGDRLRKTMAGDAAETNLKFNSHAASSQAPVSTLCTQAGRQDAGKKTGLGCLFIIVRM